MTNDEIINVVSQMTNIEKELILSRVRKQPVVDARNLAIYFVHFYNRLILTELGMVFNRDHTTIMSSLKNVTIFKYNNSDFKAKFNEIESLLIERSLNL